MNYDHEPEPIVRGPSQKTEKPGVAKVNTDRRPATSVQKLHVAAANVLRFFDRGGSESLFDLELDEWRHHIVQILLNDLRDALEGFDSTPTV